MGSSAIMMYVLPMMLGQTYHLGKDKPGLQIYPTDVQNKTVVVEQYVTDSQYRMVENSDQVKDFLSAGGSLSLRIKGGMVDVSGEGTYIKDVGSMTNGIEILVRVHFETITKTIPSSVKPKADWAQMNEKFLGTHFCRSITYGGDLIASIRITGSSTSDLMHIKAAINGGINVGKGSFEANLKGKLDLLKQSAQDSSSMEISYYATVPLHGVSYDIEGLMRLVDDFPAHVQKVNNGTGNPLRMELYPLSALKEGYPAYFENRAIGEQLSEMESQFDDLRDTRKKLSSWIGNLPPVTPDGVMTKVQEFSNTLNDIYATYLQSIGELDTSEGASTKPVQDAFAAYKAGGYTLPQKYGRMFSAMLKAMYKEHPELKPRVGGATFYHWGRSNCSTEGTEATGAGAITASQVGQNGGSSNFACVAADPARVDPKEYFPGYPGKDEPDDHLLVSPVRYRGELSTFSNMLGKPISCVQCRSSHRTAVIVHMAATKCPTDKWNKEYEGILMAPNMHSPKGEYICMDMGMQEPKDRVTFGTSDESGWSELREVAVECGSLPCGPYEVNKPIPCVVCTI